MPDCGSGGFWFESRYLPKMNYWIVSKPIKFKYVYSKKILFILKLVLIFKNLFNIVQLNSNFFIKTTLLLSRSLSFNKKLSLNDSFKSMFTLDRSLFRYSVYKGNNFLKRNSESSWNKTIFSSFLNLNSWLSNVSLKVHHSFNIFYLYNNESNVGWFNVKRVFQTWNNIIIFITNIFYYNLNYLVFGSSYFKYEVLSLNWNSLNFTKFIWKFSHPFIFFLRNKTTFYNRLFFNYINYLNFKIAFIIDIYYHSRTIYYFNRNNAITIGPVPVSSNFYTLSVSLPVASNLNFSNIFFIRLILKLKKNNAKLLISNYKSINL